jgi:hypothetical protein
MKPLTATLSMRFVVALYAVRRIVFASSLRPDSGCSVGFELSVLGEINENCRWTMEDSSSSTRSALRADEASRCVGNGTSITLQ